MAYIYRITNTINNKSYIGKTEKLNPEERFKEHIRESKKSRCEKRPLYKAMNKYGIDKFEFVLLEETKNPNEREQYYIKKFNTYGKTGYNATLGGDGKKRIILEEQEVINCYYKNGTVEKTAKAFNVCNDTISDILNKNNIKLHNRQYCSKKVYKIDKKTNEILEVYPSIRDAGKSTGNIKNTSCISRVCSGQRKTAFGYKWAYAQ